MVRRFRPDPVPPELVARITAAVRRGPSAGYAQGVSVVVVTDPVQRAAIADLGGEAEYRERGFEAWLSPAPVHLVLCVEPERYRARYDEPDKDPAALDIPWWWVDGGAALSLVLLAAVDAGLAAGFLGAHTLPGLGTLLGIPAGIEPLGVVTIGYPAPDRRSSSLERGARPEHEVVHPERWDPGPGPGVSDPDPGP